MVLSVSLTVAALSAVRRGPFGDAAGGSGFLVDSAGDRFGDHRNLGRGLAAKLVSSTERRVACWMSAI